MSEVVAVANLVATIALAALTAAYVLLTKRLADTATETGRLAANPVLGAQVAKVHIGRRMDHGRQQLSVVCELTNLGAGPAIAVQLDAEIKLTNTTHHGERGVVQRFDPEFLPFLKSDGTVTLDLAFGNEACEAVINELLETQRLNLIRIEQTPHAEPFNGPKLILSVYYKNNLGQDFLSEMAVYLSVMERQGKFFGMPDRRENLDMTMIYIPRPTFVTKAISSAAVAKRLAANSARRHLSGW